MQLGCFDTIYGFQLFLCSALLAAFPRRKDLLADHFQGDRNNTGELSFNTSISLLLCKISFTSARRKTGHILASFDMLWESSLSARDSPVAQDAL